MLSVGITGHRAGALDEAAAAALPGRIMDVIATLGNAALDLSEREHGTFPAAAPELRFVSAIADGADQIACRRGRCRSGGSCRRSCPSAALTIGQASPILRPAERFDALLGRATRVLELPGEGPSDVEAYVMTGRATVAHCDVLIAVWDGLPPRGRGGTAEVVQMAITAGRPVVHIAS